MFENNGNTRDCLFSGETMMSRRDLMKIGFAGLAAAAVPLIGAREAEAAGYGSWRVAFRHAHTGESFSGVYRVGDKYLPETFQRLNYVLRDHHSGEAFPMDPRVIDILSMVQTRMGTREPLQILSGYRCPKTNALLRRSSTGVAKNSFHMYGQAIDIRMPGYNTRRLRDAASGLKAGGVGFYPRSDFVHVDTGTVRTW